MNLEFSLGSNHAKCLFQLFHAHTKGFMVFPWQSVLSFMILELLLLKVNCEGLKEFSHVLIISLAQNQNLLLILNLYKP